MTKAFTLIEILVVLVIIGIGAGLFYSVIFVNWVSLEKQISLIDLQMEADNIIDMISNDGRLARSLNVGADGKSVSFLFPVLNPPVSSVTYSITESGKIQKTRDNNTYDISQKIDYSNSSFGKEYNSLVVNLRLEDTVFGRKLGLFVSTRVFPRNLIV